MGFNISAAEFPQQKKRASLVWIDPKTDQSGSYRIMHKSFNNMFDAKMCGTSWASRWCNLFVCLTLEFMKILRQKLRGTYFLCFVYSQELNIWTMRTGVQFRPNYWLLVHHVFVFTFCWLYPKERHSCALYLDRSTRVRFLSSFKSRDTNITPKSTWKPYLS